MTYSRTRQLVFIITVAAIFLIGLPAAASAASAGPAVVAVPPYISASPFVSASQCAFCHGSNIDNFNNPILYFKHDPHLTRGIRCLVCHTGFPHRQGGTEKPSMTVCYNCHNLPHSGQGVVASGACAYCHPNGYGAPPATHVPEFKGGAHKDPAIIDAFPCMTCHPSDLCAQCHTARKVVPKNHKEKETNQAKNWRKMHGTHRDKGGCEICHSNSFCVSCHVTPMPHPATWEGEHKTSAGALKYDCQICHEDSEKECSSCHHQFKGDTLLVEKNCTGCHEAYKIELSGLIWYEPMKARRAGIIIHKSHFEMTKTDPFECDECHNQKLIGKKGCFSFDLCYTCHGKMRGGSMIAKWGGQELCYRCHRMK